MRWAGCEGEDLPPPPLDIFGDNHSFAVAVACRGLSFLLRLLLIQEGKQAASRLRLLSHR